jgi:glycosyltransferase involved in cell wall biosynthesis
MVHSAHKARLAEEAGRAGSILVVLHDLALGGGERIAIRLANRWAASGRRVALLCGTLEGPLAPLVDPAVELIGCVPRLERGRGSRRRLGEAAAEIIRARRPDLLFVPGNYIWPILPRLRRLKHRPAIVAQIGTPMYRHGRGPLAQLEYNLRTRLRLAQVDAAVSLSDVMTRDADHVLGRRITTRINLPALEDASPPLARADGRTILAAGRLVEEKGFDVAIRAFALLDDPEARLVILGEGPRRQALTELAERLGVRDRVELPGYVPDIGPWLARARLFLLSSYYEGYAAVAVEALAAGRPVVATDCTPAAYELIDRPERGCIAAVGDPLDLSQALARALSRPPADPALIAAGVDGYRIGPIARAYLDLFDRTVERRALSARPAPQRLQPAGQVLGQAFGGQALAFGVDQGDLAR